MKRSHLLLLVPLVAASGGCNTGFDPQYRVTDLRILGVRAAVLPDPPPGVPPRADVRPGESVRFSTLVANPRGRGLTVRFFGCVPRGLDAFTACVDEELLKDPSRLAELATRFPETGVLAIGQVVLPPPPPGAPKAVEVTVEQRVPLLPGAFDPLIDRAIALPTFQCSLFAELPLVVVVEADGLSEVALKRIRAVPGDADFAEYLAVHPESASVVRALETAYTVNDNPRVDRVVRAPVDGSCQNGVPIVEGDATFPMGRILLCGVPNQGQGFNICDANGVSSQEGESRAWQWFVDAGEFPEFTGVGNAVDASPEFERPAGAFTLWVVLRDGRGGVAWEHREIAAAP